jgi:hypothetical protein
MLFCKGKTRANPEAYQVKQASFPISGSGLLSLYLIRRRGIGELG